MKLRTRTQAIFLAFLVTIVMLVGYVVPSCPKVALAVSDELTAASIQLDTGANSALNTQADSSSGSVSYGSWSASKTTTSKPTESDTLRITGQSTKYTYYRYCNYYDNQWQQDSKAYGSQSVYHEITLSYEMTACANKFADKGGKAWDLHGPHGSCSHKREGQSYWWTKSVVTTYTYQTRSKTTIQPSSKSSSSSTKKKKTKKKSISSASVKLAKVKFAKTGKAIKPKVIVKANGKTLKKGKDYTVSYPKSPVKVGAYKLTVKGKGKWKGKVKRAYKIVPKASKVISLKALSQAGAVAAKWKRIKGASGYQMWISASKKSRKGVIKTSFSARKEYGRKCAFSGIGLPEGKKLYVKVRVYKKVKGKIYHSAWSKAKTVTTRG